MKSYDANGAVARDEQLDALIIDFKLTGGLIID